MLGLLDMGQSALGTFHQLERNSHTWRTRTLMLLETVMGHTVCSWEWTSFER